MSDAWATSREDVQHVLAKHGMKLGFDAPRLGEITDGLDHEAIESAALSSAASVDIENDLGKQTAGAVIGDRRSID